jgi:hypothetical protein
LKNFQKASTGTRFFTRRKAVHRPGDPPVELLYYAMMRARGFDQWSRGKVDEAAYWREWLRTKEENRELGRVTSKSIQSLVYERITKVERDNRDLRRENEGFADLRRFLDKHGLDINRYDVRDQARGVLTGEVSERFKRRLSRLIDAAGEMQQEIGK